MNDFDMELKRRFAELRTSDERDAPDFGAMREVAARVAASSDRRPARWLAIGVIAAAAACVTLAFLAVQHSRSDARVAEVWWTPDTLTDLTHFVSPTDGLLRSARHTIETRTLFESVLDGVEMPVQTKSSKGD